MTAFPQCDKTNPTEHLATGLLSTTSNTDDPLPHFNQIAEAVSLRQQVKPKHAQIRDPLEKYTKGIMLTIHDAHPGSEYVDFEQDTIDEWRNYKGEKLLAIPFENNARLPRYHHAIRNQIFAAIREITQSKDFGVASPVLEIEDQTQNQPKRQ